ncbi:unnamed protein product [Brassica rapa]|uniref:Uncharacterized protein n=1 Tax=Brassica campestris TaxID=3711 RepID=A0A3P6A861_BRACM|nr:unnamed protein product [Brassica rapa]VDC83634.1 unnamed protein product [Brassica rapa]
MLRLEKEEEEEEEEEEGGGGCRWSLLIASSSRMEAAVAVRRCKCRTCCERSLESGTTEEGAELLSLRLRVGTGGAVTFKQHPISFSTFLMLSHSLSLLRYVLSLMGRFVQVGPCLLWAPFIPSYSSDESNLCLIDTIETKRTVLLFLVVKEKSKFHAGG